ncbi:MAG TPA: alpha/beta fold hydrolase [Ktedonobacteraceae bacterium]|nr:alpha/beta fold hydrolase [Ktedonobacteraceae bacterium]
MRDNDKISIAQQLVTWFVQGDFEVVVQNLDESLRQQLPVEKLQATLQSLVASVGKFKEQVGAHIFQIPSTELVIVTCAFANASLDINVAFNEQDKIVGLNITQVGGVEQQYTAVYDPPAYVNQDLFMEREVQIGKGEWVLPGTLSVPVGDGPFAAMLLVHGSGPNDRDETIGPNKPFCDIAWGLASQGIVVLRYDKRTKVYPEKMRDLVSSITVKEEAIDDALEAVSLLCSIPEVNSQRIVVLGHSLGGYLLPRIGAADTGIGGLVVLAGLCRTLEDTILDQYSYIYSLSGTLSAEQQKYLDELKKQVALVKSPDLSLSTPASDLPLNVSPAYWLDLRGYHPEEIARGLPQPMLILQGEGDYQVTMEDFQIWKSALGGRSDVRFKSYAGLSHLFMPFEGGEKSTPAAYNVPGHVVEEVIQDITEWVQHSFVETNQIGGIS